MRTPKPPHEMVRRFFQLTLARRFAEAERVLSSIRSQMRDVEWSRGYLQALNGIIHVWRSNHDRYAFISNLDMDDVSVLKKSYEDFVKHSKSPLHGVYDRGFFSAWTDFMRFLLDQHNARERRPNKKS